MKRDLQYRITMAPLTKFLAVLLATNIFPSAITMMVPWIKALPIH